MFDQGHLAKGVILGKMTTIRTGARADGPWGMVGTMTSSGIIAAAGDTAAAAADDTAAAAADDGDGGEKKKKRSKKKVKPTLTLFQ